LKPFIQSILASIEKQNANKPNKSNEMEIKSHKESTTYRKSLESSVIQGIWLENVTNRVKKVKLSLHIMKAYRRQRGLALWH
jgi:hypothetical protein